MLLQPLGTPPGYPFDSPSDAFTPRQISGLEYWFDAKDLASLFQDNTLTTPVTTTGQTVGGWKDKANARHLVQATGTLKPTYRSSYINGRPAVESDGVDDFLRYSGVTLAQPLTIYFVGKLTSTMSNWYTVTRFGWSLTSSPLRASS